MNPTGYVQIHSPLEIKRVITLQSAPPQCAVEFAATVYSEGHAFTVEHEINGSEAQVYVTLNIPEPGPMKGTILSSSVNLGVLDPGTYSIEFHYRESRGGDVTPFRKTDCVFLQAQEDRTVSLVDSLDWSAWIDLMPGWPSRNPTLHVVGEVRVGDEHTKVNLVRAISPGLNDGILLLNLTVETAHKESFSLDQKVRYSEEMRRDRYEQVQVVFPNGCVQLLEIGVTV